MLFYSIDELGVGISSNVCLFSMYVYNISNSKKIVRQYLNALNGIPYNFQDIQLIP